MPYLIVEVGYTIGIDGNNVLAIQAQDAAIIADNVSAANFFLFFIINLLHFSFFNIIYAYLFINIEIMRIFMH